MSASFAKTIGFFLTGTISLTLASCDTVVHTGALGAGTTDDSSSVTLSSKTIDGSGETALAAASDTSITLTAEDGTGWNELQIDLGADFTAENICAGKTVYGRLGSGVCLTGMATDPALAANVVSGKQYWDSSGTLVVGTLASQGIWNLNTSFPGTGIYTGVSNTPVSTDIRSGATILGVAGNSNVVNTSTGDATATDILSGKKAWVDGTEITGSISTSSPTQTAVAGGSENNDAVTSVTVSPSAGALFSGFVVNLGAQFQTSNICAGKTIFGRLGTSACGLASRAHRNIGSSTERNVPIVDKDHDGLYPGDGVEVANTIAPVDTSAITTCGNTQNTVVARIADCNLTWDGSAQGNSGQGSWSLVTKASGYEVWRDNRTLMLWSADLPTSLSNMKWCRAAGSVENTTSVSQGWTINCAAGGSYQTNPPRSQCAEITGFITDPNYDVAKGGMRLTATATSPSVTWRLPTRDDFTQAYLNGAVFVLQNSGFSPFWTATVVSSDRSKAWLFRAFDDGVDGNGDQLFTEGTIQFIPSSRVSAYDIRCVGR